MNSITQRILSVSLFGAALVTALNVSAETYTVEVQLNSSVGETPLSAVETIPMTYPELNVTEATQVGAICYVGGGVNYTNDRGYDGAVATVANSLCPNLTGSHTAVEFTGASNAVISVNYRLPLQVQNGVRFGWLGAEYDYTQNGSSLDANGKFLATLGSSIDLVDKSQVSDGLLVFNYEITGAYQ